VQGPHAVPLTRLEAGVHLLCAPHAAVELIEVEVLTVEAAADPLGAVAHRMQERQAWLVALRGGQADDAAEPNKLGPVVRIYHGSSEGDKPDDWRWVDPRTGLTGAADELAACLLAALPLPPEIESGSP
jgi:hypothetical protein